MEFTESLILQEGDEYSFAQLNPNIKFTPVMEEILFTLQLLFVVNYNPILPHCVDLLCELLDRSPNAIGSNLQALADLGLIDYYRSGRGRIVELHLDHPFLESALFRFFGFNDWLLEEEKKEEKNDFTHTFGFLPSEENLPKFLSFVQQEEQKVDKAISECQGRIDWIHKIERTVAYAKKSSANPEDYVNNPLRVFAEEIVLRIQRMKSSQTNALHYSDLVEIISEIFVDFRETPPWIDDGALRPQSNLLNDFLPEDFFANKKK